MTFIDRLKFLLFFKKPKLQPENNLKNSNLDENKTTSLNEFEASYEEQNKSKPTTQTNPKSYPQNNNKYVDNKQPDFNEKLNFLNTTKLNKEIENKNIFQNQLDIKKIEGSIPKESTLKKLSNFFSSFSDNTRLKIISALCFGELCVSDIANILNMNQTTISHQLSFLKSTGSVTSRRQGKTIFYKLASINIEDCLMYGAKHINYDI